MKWKKTLAATCVCAVAFLSQTPRFFHAPRVLAQSNDDPYFDGEFYIESYLDVDTNYNLYTDSYMEVEFDEYEDVDGIEVDSEVDQDGEIGYSNFDDEPYDGPAEVYVEFQPVPTGHEYGVESDGFACIDEGYGEGGYGDCDFEYIASTYASVNVYSPPPRIYGVNPSSVHVGDTGTLTLTGADFIENATDQLTLNFSGSGNPFTPAGVPTATTASYNYDFTGYAPGTYTLSVTNNEAQSDNTFFTVNASTPTPPPLAPPVDACAVTSSPQVGFTSIVPTGTMGGSGTIAVSFSGAAFSGISSAVAYGPYSTPSSIAANLAALITKQHFQRGLSAKAFGPKIIYNGLTSLGTITNAATGSSFQTDASSNAASAAKNACHATPAPPSPTCPLSVTLSLNIHEQPLAVDAPEYLTGVGILTEMDLGPTGGNFSSVLITENVTPTSNSCPSNIAQYASFPTVVDGNSTVFRIGGSARWEEFNYPGIANAFYDSHRLKLNFNLLGATNVGSCIAKATQVYKCNGQAIGQFFLTNTYTKGVINGQSVTYVDVTKQ